MPQLRWRRTIAINVMKDWTSRKPGLRKGMKNVCRMFARNVLPEEPLRRGEAFDFPRDYSWPRQPFCITLDITHEILIKRRRGALMHRAAEDGAPENYTWLRPLHKCNVANGMHWSMYKYIHIDHDSLPRKYIKYIKYIYIRRLGRFNGRRTISGREGGCLPQHFNFHTLID